MEIQVRKWECRKSVSYDVNVSTYDTDLRDTLTEEEASDLAVQFLQDTALDVRYESDIIPRLISLGVISEDMLWGWYEDQKDEGCSLNLDTLKEKTL